MKKILLKSLLSPWLLNFFLFCAILILIFGGGGKIGNIGNPERIGKKAIDFINKNLLPQNSKASLIEATREKSGVYRIKFKIDNQEFESYISPDGSLLFPSAIEIVEKKEKETSSSPQKRGEEIPKKKVAEMKVFVMSYCPFGIQFQKALIPVYKLLGKKAEISIHFVDYAMHGKKEVDENLRQYCLQKQDKKKYFSYLECFTKSGDSEKCLKEVKVDKVSLEKCIKETNRKFGVMKDYEDKSTWINGRFPRFKVEEDLNKKFNVSGSPTVVLNDKVIEVNPRSPENIKEIICQGFEKPPKECDKTLSDAVPQPGFGEGTSSSSGGSCK